MNEMRKLMEIIERINEDKDEPCFICKGKGSEWDPYATYEGGAYRKCEACRGTGDESVRLGELEDDLDEATEQDSIIKLPRGKKIILEAEGSDYRRGLIVEFMESGGYNVEYWLKDPSNVVTAEVKIDGKSIKDDVKLVHLGLHPEKDDSVDEANGILPSRGGPANYTDAAQGEKNGPDWEYWAGGIST